MRMQKDGSPVESIVLGHGLAALAAIPFYFAPGPHPDIAGWIGLAALGIFQVGLSSLLFSFAIRHLTAIGTSIITLLEPILNPVWVFIFAGEAPSIYAVLGGVVILSMVTLRSVLAVRRARGGRIATTQ
jgi:drug/metabolite transporter (DMT)-like permease